MIRVKTSYDNRQGFIKLDFSAVDMCSDDKVAEALEMLLETVSESFMEQIQTIKGSGNFLCPDEETDLGNDTIKQ